MIDHFTLTVRDLERSKAFYEEALKPLGFALKRVYPEIVGFGDERKPYFWLKQGGEPSRPMHIAFAARDRQQVDAFFAAALAAGARSDGEPGLRPHYHANYYGSFVIDPDGHPIEAVCHRSLDEPLPARARATKPARAAKKPRAGASKKARVRKPVKRAPAKRRGRKGR
jgi:catechol 2,3-dioxygenase-like lactoylglutathione lyase family enzyme